MRTGIQRRDLSGRRYLVWILRFFAAFLISAAAIWLLGLFWFAGTLDEQSPDPLISTEAIVVLTGGSGRLDAGLNLLSQGKAKKLFISGVHPGIEAPELLGLSHQHPEWVKCCLVLGHEAGNTFENAIETAQWLKKEGFHSLRLVTANYHMRRSLLEFRRVLPPGTIIVPEPVFQLSIRQTPWWLWRGGERIVVMEYLKYLAAWLRPFWKPVLLKAADARA